MTDKQIIIDGVDVAQCGFFSKVDGKSLIEKRSPYGN